MSQSGEETTQNINLNVSGAEQVAGATALLTDLSGALKQLLSNPLGGGYTMRRIAQGLEGAFVTPMKNAANFTKAQSLEFDRLILKSRNLATVVGAISGMTLGMIELIRKTKLASTEMGQFMSLNQLPGGAENFYQAQLDMQLDFIGKSLEYNSKYGEDYANMKKDLFRKLAADLTPEGMSDEQGAKFIQDIEPRINALIEQLTTLQSASRVSVSGFMQLQKQLRSFGIDTEEVTDLYRALTSEVIAGNELKSLSGREVTETFAAGLLQYKQAGTSGPAAIDQILNIMETYEPMTGVNELQNLIGLVPKFQNDLQTNMLARNIIPGITRKSLTGPEAGANLINTLAKQIHKLAGEGQTPENIMELWSKSAGGVEKLKALGITPELIQTLNNLKEIKEVSSNISDNFRNMKYGDDFIKMTDTIQKALDATSQKGTSGIFETGENLIKGVTTLSQQGLDAAGVDIDPRWMTGATILGSGLIMKRLTRKLMQKIPTILSKFSEAAIAPTVETVGAGAKFTPWGTEAAVTTTKGAGFMSKLPQVGKYAAKFGKGFGIAGALIGEGIEAYEDVQEYKEKDIGFGEGLARSTIKGMYKYNPITMAANITAGWMKIFEGENVWDALWDTDVTKMASDVIFGEGTQKPAQELANLMMPAHELSKITKGKGITMMGDKDLPNLNIIIRTAEGDILANTTLQEAVTQGAITIVMEGIVGVTK